MPDFIYPTDAEMELIAQDKIPRLTANRPVFSFFPVATKDEFNLVWEQRDNYQGLQQVRGLGGDVSRVKHTGGKRYMASPGTYGEFYDLDERALTERRRYGTFAQPADVTDLVMEGQDLLLQRRLDRIEWIIWTLLATGTFAVTGADGAVLHTDTYATQSQTSAVHWSSQATATPMADLKAVQLLSRGHSVNFGAGSMLYMNRGTSNNVLENTNPNDLFGHKTNFGATFNSIQDVNAVLTKNDLPNIAVYDEGYIDDTGTFQLYIPNNTAILVGQRPAGAVVGEYRMVRNVNNPNMAPGPYQKVIDLGEKQVPRSIQVHDGHNGGPVIYYPSAIVVMNV